MPNQSAATERPVLQFVYHTPSYRETKNFGDQYLFARNSSMTQGLTLGVPV